MKGKVLATLVAAVFSVPAMTTSVIAQEKKPTTTEKIKENVGDAKITATIKSQFAKDKLVKATKINVDTDNKGVVTLKGNVKSQAEADKAVEIAKGVKGVASVNSELTVKAN
jgi:hyperosmotically inducible protein